MNLTLLKRIIYTLVYRPLGFLYLFFGVFYGRFVLPKQPALTLLRPYVDDRTVVVVTGCNVGIGYEVALALSKAGATVFICCRTEEKCSETIRRIKQQGGRGQLKPIKLELSSFASVRAAADAINAQTAYIDFLVLNSGVMNIPKLEFSADGYEMHFAVNHLGHYLLTRRLVAKVRKGIVVVSSDGHIMGATDAIDDINWDRRGRENYDGMVAYADTKMANVLFAAECNRRYPSIRTVAVHPGAVLTELIRYSVKPEAQTRLRQILKYIFRTPAEGALVVVAALVATAVPCAGKRAPLFYRDGRPSWAVAENDVAAAQHLWDESERIVRNYLT
ncbi:similar to short-chain dehydrogenase [Cyanidioschyzon merolae strain 10D]|jgi:NAD(P)-dependent dehydrogenase (short-subunit alcohol dehydrogenase family)|uniref:Similar to short-chain dehydrogenase n=1 Tax=Cyanidioschyzon merolae (strain NIES-3377 / 10D) TaxID=280699 RepID=M1V608_CYAM1|nr:similar to short-chain dehydrogenase [Cyanidioschyzon merolae strain 10D]BAM81595.1 similar to short-chain dehydrogenase [Cyanidioschyzon merolae strain 10D]|eukprot:XP_005537631.1 similar to short-chain dehydrogenase [Cyanidioschyzon merolae strain 10D]